jgi:hypothetical protein
MSTLEHLAFAAGKAADRPEYLAYYFHEFRRFEQITEAELVALLRCDLLGYYQACLSTAPDFEAPSFGTEVRRIAEAANASFPDLITILRRAYVLSRINGVASETGRWLSAARDKDFSKPTP